jgi:glycosyltransferase involved in cell wall biosynthesis
MKQKLGLVMIVRDEESVIGETLFHVKQHIARWTIFDTGSTDRTKDLILEALGDVPGSLRDGLWVNFGVNRSEAFAAARGTADWLLLLDADMTVEIDPDFEPDPSVDAYMVEMGDSAGFSYRLPLLVRGDLPWESRGAVHEYTCLSDGGLGIRVPTDGVRIRLRGDRVSPEKTRWQYRMLEDDLQRDPDNPRTVFYLAQSLRELGSTAALGMYDRRVAMGGWEEERFYAAYRAALLRETWAEVVDSLLRAWEMRPHRLEPLHDLVQMLNQAGLHQAAYRLSGVPISPTSDILFVHGFVWEWGLLFERSIAAWWVGEVSEFRDLCAMLLAKPTLPANIRAAVESNLALEVPG